MIISDRGKVIFEGKENDIYYDLALIFKGILERFGDYEGENILFSIYDDIKTFRNIKISYKNRL